MYLKSQYSISLTKKAMIVELIFKLYVNFYFCIMIAYIHNPVEDLYWFIVMVTGGMVAGYIWYYKGKSSCSSKLIIMGGLVVPLSYVEVVNY